MVLSRRFVLKMNHKDKYVWLYDDNSSILSSISDTAFFTENTLYCFALIERSGGCKCFLLYTLRPEILIWKSYFQK